MKSKLLIKSLGFSSLIFIPGIIDLHEIRYFVFISYVEKLSIVFGLLLITLVIYFLFVIIEHSIKESRLKDFLLSLIYLSCLIPLLNDIRSIYFPYSISKLFQGHYVLLGIIFFTIMSIVIVVIMYLNIQRILATLGSIVSPISFVIILEVIGLPSNYTGEYLKSNPMNEVSTESTKLIDNVFLILFDSFSNSRLEQLKSEGLVPNFNDFSNSSISFKNAFSPSKFTTMSISSMITRKSCREFRV